MQYLQVSLKFSGVAPKDKRGKHNNRPNRLQTQIIDDIKEHLKSFKGHLSLTVTKKHQEFDIKSILTFHREISPSQSFL